MNAIVSRCVQSVCLLGFTGSRLFAAGPFDSWNPEQPVALQKVVAFKNQFIGSGGGIYSSPDGHQWSRQLAYGSYPFPMLAADDAGLVLPLSGSLRFSVDGRGFDDISLPPWLSFEAIAYHDRRFVGVMQRPQAGPYSPALGWSADGSDWTTLLTNVGVAQVFFTHTNFIASIYGTGPDSSRLLGFSSDAANWTFTPLPASAPLLNAAAWGRGTYVGLGTVYESASKFRSQILTFSSAHDLQVRLDLSNVPLNDIAFDGSQFIAVGDRVLNSPDGVSWTQSLQLSNTAAFASVSVLNGNSSRFLTI